MGTCNPGVLYFHRIAPDLPCAEVPFGWATLYRSVQVMGISISVNFSCCHRRTSTYSTSLHSEQASVPIPAFQAFQAPSSSSQPQTSTQSQTSTTVAVATTTSAPIASRWYRTVVALLHRRFLRRLWGLTGHHLRANTAARARLGNGWAALGRALNWRRNQQLPQLRNQ